MKFFIHARKLLSAILLIALCLPLGSFGAAASENSLELDENGDPILYVSLAGSDEESDTMGTAENPLKTIDAAISLINKMGLQSGDRATVKIITTTETDEWGDVGYVAYQNSSTHKATITYTSADSDGKAYLSCYGVKGSVSNSLWVHGPSVFENLKLIDQRNDGSARGAYLQGHDVTFRNVEHYRLNNGNTLVAKKVSVMQFLNRTARGTIGTGGRFTLYDGSTASDVTMGGLRDNASQLNPTTDVTFVLNGGTLPKLYLSCSTSGCATTFGRNVNIVLNDSSVTALNSNSKGETVAPPTVKGGLQILLNRASVGTMSINASDVNGDAVRPYIIVTQTDGAALDVTEEVGVYTVSGGKIAYALDPEEECVYYGADTLSIPRPGTWNILYADSKDAMLSDIQARLSVTELFDDGRGTIFAKIPRYRHVMKITDTGKNSFGDLEGNSGLAYLSETTTLFGETVRRITRNPDVSDADAKNARPLFFKHAAIRDENGKKIPVGEVRYITISYYFDSDEESPSLDGLPMNWTQGRFLDENDKGEYISRYAVPSSLYEGTAPNVIRANTFSTVTIDMHKDSTFLGQYTDNPTYSLGQYKLKVLNAMMKQSESLYIGDILFTSYDPSEEFSVPTKIFISENGSDENDGTSLIRAVKTITRAYELAQNAENITFILDGTVTQGDTAADHPNLTARFSSLNPNAPSTVSGDFYAVSDAELCDVSFEKITVSADHTVTVMNTLSSVDTLIAEKGTVTIRDGKVGTLSLSGNDPTSSLSVTLQGGDVTTLCADGTLGNVWIRLDGNYADRIERRDSASAASLTLLTDGDVPNPDALLSLTDRALFVTLPRMKGPNGEIFEILPTGEPGKFAASAVQNVNFGYGLTTYLCYAEGGDGRTVYYASSVTDRILTLPQTGAYRLYIAGEKSYSTGSKDIPGFTTSLLTLPLGATGWQDDGKGTIRAVMTEESSRFLNDGKVLSVFADSQTFTLSELSHVESDDTVFLGWSYDADGNDYPTAETVTLNNGDHLYAQYAENPFSVLGVQMRLSGITGIRFITETKKSFIDSVLSASEYGSVVLPTEYLGTGELIADGTYTSGKKTYTAKTVAALKTFAYDEATDALQYTVCITGIDEPYYKRSYTVRPYVRYTDRNGLARIAYAESYGTSPLAVSHYALRKDKTLDESSVSALNEIYTKGLADLETPIEYTYGSADSTEEDYRQGKVIYTTASGVKICKIPLSAKGSKKTPVTIGVITDTHLNVVSEKDRYDPEVQYSNKTRYWLRGGTSVRQAKISADFADLYDQFVVTGDIIDYLSYGALDTAKEILFDAHPDGLYAMGGHDVTKHMETGLSNALPLTKRQQMNQDYYKHNIFYASRLVADSVLCIQMDNGSSRYWNEQVEKLSADLALARENGYTVLLFQHEPLATGNPEDTAVPSLCRDADSSKVTYNFYGSAHIGGNGIPNPPEASVKVYNLITQNADIIGGIFCGHRHYRYYTEIKATDPDGNALVIPQYVLRASAYEKNGYVTKIVFG